MGWEIFFTAPIISFLLTIITIDAGFIVLRLSYYYADAEKTYDQLHEFDKVVYRTIIGIIILFPIKLILPTPTEGYSLFHYINENLTLPNLMFWFYSAAFGIFIISWIISFRLEREEIKQPSKILLFIKWIADKLRKNE